MNFSNLYSTINLYRITQEWDLKKNLAYFNKHMTEAKVQRCAIMGLGFLVALRTSPLAVATIAGSMYGAYYFIKDYDDVQEVEMMRKKALSLAFLPLIQEHKSIAQILDAKILTYKELALKLKEEISKAKKINSEELPRLLQFQKQLNARKDPEEKNVIAEALEKKVFYFKNLFFS